MSPSRRTEKPLFPAASSRLRGRGFEPQLPGPEEEPAPRPGRAGSPSTIRFPGLPSGGELGADRRGLSSISLALGTKNGSGAQTTVLLDRGSRSAGCPRDESSPPTLRQAAHLT